MNISVAIVEDNNDIRNALEQIRRDSVVGHTGIRLGWF